mmetsp:Transcript_43480/g.108560  ORF Transcript_43480/g.108560 Transcript_43480/m.108560 type:complete len:218 (+) Transcript_43480:552-1205(+)
MRPTRATGSSCGTKNGHRSGLLPPPRTRAFTSLTSRSGSTSSSTTFPSPSTTRVWAARAHTPSPTTPTTRSSSSSAVGLQTPGRSGSSTSSAASQSSASTSRGPYTRSHSTRTHHGDITRVWRLWATRTTTVSTSSVKTMRRRTRRSSALRSPAGLARHPSSTQWTTRTHLQTGWPLLPLSQTGLTAAWLCWIWAESSRATSPTMSSRSAQGTSTVQ